MGQLTIRVLLAAIVYMQYFRPLMAIGSVYSLDDPRADHTAEAIKYDKRGDEDGMIRSFIAAAYFDPSFRSKHNLAVAYMRAGHKRSKNQKRALFYYSLAYKQFESALSIEGAQHADKQTTKELMKRMISYYGSQHNLLFNPIIDVVYPPLSKQSSEGITTITTTAAAAPVALQLPLHDDGTSLFWRGDTAAQVHQDTMIGSRQQTKNVREKMTTPVHDPKPHAESKLQDSLPSALQAQLNAEDHSKIRVSTSHFNHYNPEDSRSMLSSLQPMKQDIVIVNNSYIGLDEDSHFGIEWAGITDKILQRVVNIQMDPQTGARPFMASSDPVIAIWDNFISGEECDEALQFFDDRLSSALSLAAQDFGTSDSNHMHSTQPIMSRLRNNSMRLSTIATTPWCFSDLDWATRIKDSHVGSDLHPTDPVRDTKLKRVCFNHPQSISTLISHFGDFRTSLQMRRHDAITGETKMDQKIYSTDESSILTKIATRAATMMGLPPIYLAPPKFIEFSQNIGYPTHLNCGRPQDNNPMFAVQITLQTPSPKSLFSGAQTVFPDVHSMNPVNPVPGRALLWRNLHAGRSATDGGDCDPLTRRKITPLNISQYHSSAQNGGRVVVLVLSYHIKPPIFVTDTTKMICDDSVSCELVVDAGPEHGRGADKTGQIEEEFTFSTAMAKEMALGAYSDQDPYLNHRARGIAAGRKLASMIGNISQSKREHNASMLFSHEILSQIRKTALVSCRAAVKFSNTFKDHANLAVAIRQELLVRNLLNASNQNQSEHGEDKQNLCVEALTHLDKAASTALELSDENTMRRMIEAIKKLCSF